MRGSAAAVFCRAVRFAQAADTDGFAEIDVAGDGSGADVEPVGGLGREFIGVGGFNGVDPACWGGVLLVSHWKKFLVSRH
jgi:hypothetical protein